MDYKNREILKYYLLLSFPIKAILVQTVVFGRILGLPNPSQFLNFFFILLNIVFILIYLKFFLYERYIFPLFILILSFTFIAIIQPIFSFYHTHQVFDFGWYLKILSWISILPLSLIAFNSIEDIFLLRKWGIVSFIIIIIGLLIGNILKIGNTAYDYGLFYMGLWSTEAPLSITLLGFTPFFLLPKVPSKKFFSLDMSGIVFLFINFILLILVMKRSSILAFLIFIIVTICYFFFSKKIMFRFKHLFVSFSIIILILIGSYSLLVITQPDALTLRTKDFLRAEQTDDIMLLGSGRLGLSRIYLQVFFDQPFSKKIIGIDFLGGIDPKSSGYLNTGINIPPHNDFIDVMINSGLLGLGLFFAIFLVSFSMVLRIYRKNNDRTLAYTSAITLGMYASFFIISLGGSFQSNIMLTGFMMLLGANIGIAQMRIR